MSLKTAFLFFGTILILLQFCHVSCDSVEDGAIKVDPTSGRLSFECSRTLFSTTNDYKCKFQLSNGIFIEYKSQINGKQVNVNTTVKYQIIHPTSTEVENYRRICKIEVDAPLEELEKSNSWKCWIITRDNTFGNYFEKSLNETAVKLKPNISSSAVYTKIGDMFIAGCQVMHPIDYCYLVSPNGTQYAVTTSQDLPNYPGTEIQFNNYQGNRENYNKRMYNSAVRTLTPSKKNNFQMGDCFGLFDIAVKSMEGNWTCQLHLAKPQESIAMALNFTVNVTNSYLLPAHTEGSSPKTLSCNAIPSLPSKVVDCRWAFLNGTMISEDRALNVTMSKNDTSCMITFNDWKGKEWHDEKWTCFVQFVNDFGDKFHASDIVSSSTISLPMLINVVLLTIFSLLHYVYTC